MFDYATVTNWNGTTYDNVVEIFRSIPICLRFGRFLKIHCSTSGLVPTQMILHYLYLKPLCASLPDAKGYLLGWDRMWRAVTKHCSLMKWEWELAAYTHEVTNVSLGSSSGDLCWDFLPLWLDGRTKHQKDWCSHSKKKSIENPPNSSAISFSGFFFVICINDTGLLKRSKTLRFHCHLWDRLKVL